MRTATQEDVAAMGQPCRIIAGRLKHLIHDPALSADDLAQIGMIGVMNASKNWDGRGAFRTWAWQKAEYEMRRKLSRQHGRSKLKPEWVSLDAPVTEDGGSLLDFRAAPTNGEEWLSVTSVLAPLPAVDRALVLMHVVYEVPQHSLGMPLRTAQAHIQRSLKRLRAETDRESLRAA